MPIRRVWEYVQSFDSSLKPIEFQQTTGTVEEAAQAVGVEPAQIAKTILFKAGDNYGLFVTAGDVKVKQKVVKNLLGGKSKMASPEEVEEVTGYRIGGVCPFALAKEIPIFLDESMKRFEVVYTAAGTPRSALPISFEKLQEITRGKVVNVC